MQLVTGNRKIMTKEQRTATEYYRLHSGDKIAFNTNIPQYPILDNIEFLKDGGWGISDREGNILIGNHLVQRPSETFSMYVKSNSPFRVIQDRDTGLYGVLSIQTFKETIHCQYEKIEVVEYWLNNNVKYIFKTQKNNKWGCYDENCALIVECVYDDINIMYGWIEGCRDGNFLYSEVDINKYDSIYEGRKDLYNREGKLLIGGYNKLESDGEYLKFYWGIHYIESYIKKTDFYDNEMEFLEYKINYSDAICLVVNKTFKTILAIDNNFYQLSLGNVYNSIEELKGALPKDIFFQYQVDLSDIKVGFVYMVYSNGDGMLINDYYIEDDKIIIVYLSNCGMILWKYSVNEIGQTDYGTRLFRQGERIGTYSKNGISNAEFSAISTDIFDNKIFVAKVVPHNGVPTETLLQNPNYILHKNCSIRYYELMPNGNLNILDNNWKVFNPPLHKWFPANFLEKNGLIDNDLRCYGGSPGLSYEKYGGYNGYDDDTIDEGFDGFPEATWNVD